MDNMKTIAGLCVIGGIALWHIACFIVWLIQDGYITPSHPKAVGWTILIVSGTIAVTLISIATYMAYTMWWST